MNFAEPKNKNYSAVVVQLDHFVNLPNCDNVKAALIFGNSVIVAKGVQAGEIGVFFPVETALSKDFLGNNNLFRKPEWGNVDPAKKGYFEEQGRIKAVTFRGHKSEGFWIPLESLAYLGLPLTEFPVGAEFDYVNDAEICKKYIPKRNRVSNPCRTKGKNKSVKDRLIEGQFAFHIDTAQLGRNVHRISPSTIISISDKWHGTSAIFSHVLIQKPAMAECLQSLFVCNFLRENFNEAAYSFGTKVVKFLTALERKIGVFFGADEVPTEYGFTWASRRVIKGVNGEAKSGSIHFYKEDIWSIVGKKIEPLVPKGYTIYGEIVGYMPDGGMIQKGYHYGCDYGTHRFLVYRITSVNTDGKVIELSWQAMKEFCAKYGLEFVKEFYFGRADGFFPVGKVKQNYYETEVEVKTLVLGDLDIPLFNEDGSPMTTTEIKIEVKKDTFAVIYDQEVLLSSCTVEGREIPSRLGVYEDVPMTERDWQDAFLVAVQMKYVRDEMCPHNAMEVPLEGVIVRVERYNECESYKLKSFLFKKRESDLADKGELDVETVESEGDEEQFDVVEV